MQVTHETDPLPGPLGQAVQETCTVTVAVLLAGFGSGVAP